MESNTAYPSVTQNPAPRSSRGTRVALAVILAAVLGVAAFTGVRVKQAVGKRDELSTERAAAQAAATRKPTPTAVHPVPTRFRPRVEMTGTLKPWREADVGFEAGGRLVKVFVATGDTVKAGQMLALLDGARAGDMVQIKDASVRAAAASLALAEDARTRAESLAQSKSIPEAQAEQARQQVALAKAQLQAAQGDAQLARTGAGQNAIVAPFAGVITRAPTAGGGVVQGGAPLVHLEDLSHLRLSATVGEDDVSLVSLGSKVSIRYRERAFTGTVTAVVPSLDQATRRAPIEIEVPNDPTSPLLAWSFVRASVEAPTEVDALRIPATAHRAGSQDEVVRVEGGVAHVVRVTHNVAEDGSWIVRDGLRPTDVVLVAPNADLNDGDAVPSVEIQ